MPAQPKAGRRKSTAPKQEFDRALLLSLYEKMVLLRRFETARPGRLPQGRDARLLPPLYRRGGDRGRRLRPSARQRLDHLDPSRPRPCARQGHGPEDPDGRALRQARRLLRRARRHHASLRPLGRPVRHQRHRRGRHRPRGRRRHQRPHARPRRHRRRLLRRRRDQPWRLPRGGRISPASRRRRWCSSARTTSTPPRRRLPRRRSTPRSPPRPPPTAFPASPSTATTCSRSSRSTREAVARARRGDGPTLIEAKTYRTVGHHEGDPVVGTYRTQDEVDALAASAIRSRSSARRLVEEFGIGRAPTSTRSTREIEADRAGSARIRPQRARARPGDGRPACLCRAAQPGRRAASGRGRRRRSSRAGSTRCATASPRKCGAIPHILYFGEGTGERGGTFAHTKNLFQEFGGDRMVDTPISEQGFTGAALGASATGARTIADLMFADFLFEAGGQIVLQAAKLRYMSNGQMNAPMVIRVGMGAVRSAGPHHSGTYHPVWAHVPGPDRLRAVEPGRRQGADEDGAARRRSGDDAGAEGAVRHQGRGAGRRASRALRRRAHRARAAATSPSPPPASSSARRWRRPRRWRREGIEAEVIDLRTIMPLDVATVADSVAKTHRLLVVDEAWAMCGVGAELAQAMNETRLRRSRRAGRPPAHRRDDAIRWRRRSNAPCWSTPTRSSPPRAG